jgi:L-asparaginase
MQEKNQKITKKVVVLGLGGTIAGLAKQADDNVNYQAGQVSVADLLAGLLGEMKDLCIKEIVICVKKI